MKICSGMPNLFLVSQRDGYTQSHTHTFHGLLSGTTWVSWYQKGKTNLDFTEARNSESQWHQLGHMQVCTALLTDSHASTPPLSFLWAGCPSCHSTNSIKALKATRWVQEPLKINNLVKFAILCPSELDEIWCISIGYT